MPSDPNSAYLDALDTDEDPTVAATRIFDGVNNRDDRVEDDEDLDNESNVTCDIAHSP